MCAPIQSDFATRRSPEGSLRFPTPMMPKSRTRPGTCACWGMQDPAFNMNGAVVQASTFAHQVGPVRIVRAESVSSRRRRGPRRRVCRTPRRWSSPNYGVDRCRAARSSIAHLGPRAPMATIHRKPTMSLGAVAGRKGITARLPARFRWRAPSPSACGSGDQDDASGKHAAAGVMVGNHVGLHSVNGRAAPLVPGGNVFQPPALRAPARGCSDAMAERRQHQQVPMRARCARGSVSAAVLKYCAARLLKRRGSAADAGAEVLGKVVVVDACGRSSRSQRASFNSRLVADSRGST